MVYCPKCGNENEYIAEYCTKCGNSLASAKKKYDKTQARTSSLEQNVENFAEEVGQVGRKAGKIIEQGAKTIGEEVRNIGKKDEGESEDYKRLYRSGKNKYLGGVCGGVAEYFKMDPTLIRILWTIIVFFPPGLGIIMYVLFWIFVPRNPNHNWN